MPYNGVGTFEQLPPPQFPAVAGDVIRSSDYNAVILDLISGLSNAFPRDGQATATGNWAFGGHNLSGIGTLDGLLSYAEALSGALPTNVTTVLRRQVYLQNYATCDGTTNDYVAIMNLHDNVPDGTEIIVTGTPYFTSGLAFTRRVSWNCVSEKDYFKPNVGAGVDAITLTGGTAAAALNCNFNIYSNTASSCKSGLVLNKYWFSDITAHVQVRGAAYSVEVYGALESNILLRSSVNYTTPLGSAYCPPNHLKIDTFGGGTYKTNANRFKVYFAGSSLGIVINDQSNEGNNEISGVIQGLTGTPIQVVGCRGLTFSDLHLEGNPTSSVFTSCTNLGFNDVVNTGGSGPITLTSCLNAKFDTYLGSLSIAASSDHTKLINCRLDSDTFVDLSATTEMIGGGITSSGSTSYLHGGGGMTTPENFFQNPFVDIWTNGVSSAPDGFSAVAATFSRSGSAYPLNGSAYSCAVTSTATALTNACTITPAGTPFTSATGERWVSIILPVYVATGQTNVIAYIFDGTTNTSLDLVTVKDTWYPIRASVKVPAGSTPVIRVIPYNGAAYVAGNFSIGACSMVTGTSSPKYPIDSGARSAYVVNSTANAPAFNGQRAFVSGTGKWYQASGGAWYIQN